MKQNSRPIVDEVAKSSGVSFDELDCAIESFSAGVVDSVFPVVEQARQMSPEHFDYLLDGFQTTAHGVVRPCCEETLSRSRVVIAPELSERFFDTPCSAGLEVELIQGAKRNRFRRASIGIALKPAHLLPVSGEVPARAKLRCSCLRTVSTASPRYLET